jgi:hypothetical protein
MKRFENNQTQNTIDQNAACKSNIDAGAGNSGISNNPASELHEKLKQMAAEESSTMIRDLRIRLLEPVESITKRGNTITMMAWEYKNADHDEAEWKLLKSPLYTDETRLLIENGPYEESSTYRVTIKKDENNYWSWAGIENVETHNQQIEGGE